MKAILRFGSSRSCFGGFQNIVIRPIMMEEEADNQATVFIYYKWAGQCAHVQSEKRAEKNFLSAVKKRFRKWK